MFGYTVDVLPSPERVRPFKYADELGRVTVQTTGGDIIGELSSGGPGDTELWIPEDELSSVPQMWVVQKSKARYHGTITFRVYIPESHVLGFDEPPRPVRSYGGDPNLQ